MGTWSEDIFGNDISCDVRDQYLGLIAAGSSVDRAAKHVQSTFAELDSDDRRIAWIALAATQIVAGTVNEGVRKQALKGIAWCEVSNRDPERHPFELAALAGLRDALGGPAPKSRENVKSRVAPGRMGDVLAITLPSTGSEVVIVVGGPSGHDRGPEYRRVVLLPDLPVSGVTLDSTLKALSEWRHYREVWTNGLGRGFGCYDISGRLPPRRTRALLRGLTFPDDFERRMRGTGATHRAADLPYVLEYDIGAWEESEWTIDPSDPEGGRHW